MQTDSARQTPRHCNRHPGYRGSIAGELPDTAISASMSIMRLRKNFLKPRRSDHSSFDVPVEAGSNSAASNRKSGDSEMRVMVIVKANKESEAGVLPDTELLAKMGKYNEQLVKAGVMLAGDGLQPTSKGKRVKFSGDKRTVIDGPFTETKELIAGYWLWQVRSIDEAVEWLKRAPFDGGVEIEIRPVYEATDFGE